MRRERKLLGALLKVAYLVVITLLIYANLCHYVLGQVVIASVQGYSMLPLLQSGDVVVVVPANDLAPGDVIVFRNDLDELVIHRVVAIVECEGLTLYLTKGDNNRFLDQRIIVYKNSIACPNGTVVAMVEGPRPYIAHVRSLIESGEMRGMTAERVIGKALQRGPVLVKITGLALPKH